MANTRPVTLKTKWTLKKMERIEEGLRHGESTSFDKQRRLYKEIETRGLLPFLKEKGLLHCLVLHAVDRYKVHQLNVTDIKKQRLGSKFWDAIFASLTSQKRWGCAMRLLVCTNDFQRTMTWFRELEEEDELDMFDLLTHRLEGAWLKAWFMYASVCGKIGPIKLFLCSENKHAQHAVCEALNKTPSLLARLVQYACKWRQAFMLKQLDQSTQKGIDCAKCLFMAGKAGLFSKFLPPVKFGSDADEASLLDRPLGIAVLSNQPDLVRFLYEVGAAANNLELLRLSQHPILKERCQVESMDEEPSSPSNEFPLQDDVHAARDIRKFLSSKGSEPRSLQDLCLLDMTKRVGWGLERDRKVEPMEIPVVLKELLTNDIKKTGH